MSDYNAFSLRLQMVVNHKLAAACKICGISVEDTKSGKKHINQINGQGFTTYVWAEEKLALVKVQYGDNEIKIRRIKRSEFLLHRLKKLFSKRQGHGRTD